MNASERKMTKNLIRSLPQLQSMFDAIERSKLDKVVWEVLCGLSSKFELLSMKLKEHEGQGTGLLADERNVIGDFIK